MSRRTLFRALLTTVALVAVGLAVRDLVRQWGELGRQPVLWAIRPGYLVAAGSVALATYLVLIDSWRRVLAGYVGSSRVDLQACKLEYSIVSPK